MSCSVGVLLGIETGCVSNSLFVNGKSIFDTLLVCWGISLPLGIDLGRIVGNDIGTLGTTKFILGDNNLDNGFATIDRGGS